MELGDRRILARFVAVGLLVPLYYELEWRPLCLVAREGVRWLLGLLGHGVTSLDLGDKIYLALTGSGAYEITANCTYADLVLVLAPFVWRVGRPLPSNLCRLTTMATAVFTIDLARVALAVHFHELDVSWQLAHAVPDIAIHMATITCAVLLALRADARLSRTALPELRGALP